MPKYSIKSLEQLRGCDHRLQRLFLEVIKHVDNKILKGFRDEAEQNEAFTKGSSKTPLA